MAESDRPRIPEEWRDHVVPIAQLKHYPGNAKQHDLGDIKASLRRRGQYRQAVVQRSTGYVVIGNGMMDAALELGWTELAVLYRDLTDDEAREWVLYDNRSTELGGYDTDALLALLQQVPGGDLAHTAYRDEELADLLAASRPPDLDELHDKYGDPQPDDTHVRVAFMVPPDVAALWREAADATGITDDEERAVALVKATHAALVGQQV